VDATINALVASIIFIIPLASFASEDAFILRNISIDTEHCLKVPSEEAQFACHRFQEGGYYAIAFRKYWPAKAGDDDAFEKITILFKKKPISGETMNFPNDQIFAFFSSGPSSFPGKHGCFGPARSGNVEILSESDGAYKVRLNIDFDLLSPLGWANECKKSNVAMTLDAKPLDFKKLNAWYGQREAGRDIWNEAHPN
jgi:hypothetical protein